MQPVIKKINNILFYKYWLLFLACILQFSNYTFSQKTKILIKSAESLEYDEKLGKDIQRLIGNVVFQHENATMYCDSAYFNKSKNTIDAYHNIRVIQGDSLSLTGDHLLYDGNTKVAQVRGDVEMIHHATVLTTHFLDFDRVKNVGYYYNHGIIKDKENTLNSNRGYYYSLTYDFFSLDSVTLVNEKYTMYSDTLKYNTQRKISYFLGPTLIRGDSNYIYCENGWYNTQTEISQYNKNAFLVNGAQKLKGDSLYYDRNLSLGKAYNNVELTDTSQKIILRGNYGYYHENPEQAIITDKALFIQLSENDSIGYDSLYMHADTIRLDVFPPDTFKVIRAYHHVKFFKQNLQGKCDSMCYSLKDSVIRLFNAPIIWSDDSQMTADSINIFSKNNHVEKVVMLHTAFITIKEDTARFNQMKGKTITGFVTNNEINRIEITGNGQSVYYIKDEKAMIGVNRADCSSMVVFRKNKKFDKILFLSKPEAILHPVDKVTKEDIFLKNFKWLENLRPLIWTDVFLWKE